MLTGKQKRYLRSLAMNIEPVVQIGKFGLEDTVVDSARKAITKRELIKVKLNQNTLEELETVAAELTNALQAELVQIIGKNVVLFKQKKENSKFELPE